MTRGLALFLTVAAAARAGRHAGPAAGRRRDAPAPADDHQRARARQRRVARHRGERAGAVPHDAARSADGRCSISATSASTGAANRRGRERASSPIAGVVGRARRVARARRSRACGSRSREPVAHHVRSDRNTIVVDFDRSPRAGVPYVLPPRRVAAPRPTRCRRSTRVGRAACADPTAALAATVAAAAAGAAGRRPRAARAAAGALRRRAAPPQQPQRAGAG